MKQTDDVFESLNWSIFRLLPDLFEDNGGKGPRNAVLIKFLFFVAIILLFVGDEAVKLIFRKGFGSKGVHWWKVLLCILTFGAIGYYSLEIGTNEYESTSVADMGSQYSFLITGVFYYLLAAWLFYKGFLQRRNRSAEKYYRGDSILLAFLIGKGWNWSQAQVQNLAEPLMLFCTGALFSAANLVLGIPLMFCALSSGLTYLVENLTGVSRVRDTLAQRGRQTSEKDEYSNVNY